MSPGEWIQLAALVVVVLGGAGGFIWWAAGRDAKASASSEAQKELKQSQAEMKSAMVNLTDAMKENTLAIGSLEGKLESYQTQTDKEHNAIWKKVDWLQDQVVKRGRGEQCDNG